MNPFLDLSTDDALTTIEEQALILNEEGCRDCLSFFNPSLFADDAFVKSISAIAVTHCCERELAHALMRVCSQMSHTHPLVRKAGVHAAAAVVLAAHLSESQSAALRLPWAFAATAAN
jgi:hypothetical protein